MAIVIRTKNIEAVKVYYQSNNKNCKNPGLFDRVINEMKVGGEKFLKISDLKEFEMLDIEGAILKVFKPIETQLSLLDSFYDDYLGWIYNIYNIDTYSIFWDEFHETEHKYQNFRSKVELFLEFYKLVTVNNSGSPELSIDAEHLIKRMVFANYQLKQSRN